MQLVRYYLYHKHTQEKLQVVPIVSRTIDCKHIRDKQIRVLMSRLEGRLLKEALS